jgi:hypothetical protein
MGKDAVPPITEMNIEQALDRARQAAARAHRARIESIECRRRAAVLRREVRERSERAYASVSSVVGRFPPPGRRPES